jgi:hypothetical protein
MTEIQVETSGYPFRRMETKDLFKGKELTMIRTGRFKLHEPAHQQEEGGRSANATISAGHSKTLPMTNFSCGQGVVWVISGPLSARHIDSGRPLAQDNLSVTCIYGSHQNSGADANPR